MSGYNANYRNSAADKDYRLAFNAGHTNASVPVRVPPSVGLNEIECGEIVTDELTTSTFRSLYRFSNIVKCQRYYSVLFEFRIDDVNADVMLYVRSAAFEPFVTVWRNASTRFHTDAEQSTQVEKVVPINVTADITGVFILEVSSMNPYATGEFEVELVCDGGDSGILPKLASHFVQTTWPGTQAGFPLLYQADPAQSVPGPYITNGMIVAAVIYDRTIGNISNVIWDYDVGAYPSPAQEPMTFVGSVDLGNYTLAIYVKVGPATPNDGRAAPEAYVVATASVAGTIYAIGASAWVDIQGSPTDVASGTGVSGLSVNIDSETNDMICAHAISMSEFATFGNVLIGGEGVMGFGGPATLNYIGGGIYNTLGFSSVAIEATTSPSDNIAIVMFNIRNV
jgi:hypothetical protein